MRLNCFCVSCGSSYIKTMKISRALIGRSHISLLRFKSSHLRPHSSLLGSHLGPQTSHLRRHILHFTTLTSALTQISHLTSYTLHTHTHLTSHTSHLIAHTSLFTPFASPLKLHTSFFTPHNPHLTPPSSHLSSTLRFFHFRSYVRVKSDDEHMVMKYTRVYTSSSCEFEDPCFKNT